MMKYSTLKLTRLKVPFRLKSPLIGCKGLLWHGLIKPREMFKLNNLKKSKEPNVARFLKCRGIV